MNVSVPRLVLTYLTVGVIASLYARSGMRCWSSCWQLPNAASLRGVSCATEPEDHHSADIPRPLGRPGVLPLSLAIVTCSRYTVRNTATSH